jgi:hypothetical protein
MSVPADPTRTAPADAPGRFRVRVADDLPLSRIFTPREADLVQRILDLAGASGIAGESRALARLREVLDGGLRSLATIALALESYPSLREREVLADRERSFDTLLRTLTEGGEHGLEWSLPTKAVLSRTYGIAKVNFLTAISYALEPVDPAAAAPLVAEIHPAIEEAVYTRLAEELYAAFVTSRMTGRRTKVLAAEHLVDLWEGRVRLATDRFCPLLRSAWAARTRAPRIFGTMLGTQEILALLFQDCDERVVRWFQSQGMDSDQAHAFEEFVFDLPFENLELVRTRMRQDGRTCVGPREVERYLGFGEGQLRPLVGDAKGLYSSFRRRRVKAQYRGSVGVPGPKRTAEGYLLEALLLEEGSRDPKPVP